ncbi:MAG: DUF5606 domain-containing protein [Rikenellaceae bacterium]
MKFSEVIAISGQPGLFMYLAQGKAGIIVESIVDKRRFPVSATAKVSSLNDIAIYTEGEDIPLAEVFQKMHDALNGKEAINSKSDIKELTKAFGEYLPSYDKDRVHSSDIKKVFAWYNMLIAYGMTEFVEKEDTQKEEQ